jgi:tRNA G18 (ribose-2'-O)-methylase SpoU
MIKITDLNDPRITDFVSLKNKIHELNNTIIIESEKVILRALEANISIIKILATNDFFENYKGTLPDCENYIAEKFVLENIVGFKLHHGCFALAHKPKYSPLKELCPPYLILNGITSPENIGTILRSCAAFGMQSIIIDKKSSSAYLRRSIRVSMGHLFKLNIHLCDSIASLLPILKDNGTEVFSTTGSREDANSLDKFFNKNIAVVMGSEGHGVDRDIIENSDSLITLKTANNVSSLNVANATSIILYEISKNFNQT